MLSRGQKMVKKALEQQCSNVDRNILEAPRPPEIQNQSDLNTLEPEVITPQLDKYALESLLEITPENQGTLDMAVEPTESTTDLECATTDGAITISRVVEPVPGTSGVRNAKRKKVLVCYNDFASDNYQDFSSGSSDDFKPEDDKAEIEYSSDESDDERNVQHLIENRPKNENGYIKNSLLVDHDQRRYDLNAEDKEILSKKRKSRRRTRNPDTWRRKDAALKRAKGQAYITQKGKEIPAKSVNVNQLCQCKLKCSEKINIEKRESLFNDFYKMGTNTKNAFLFKSIIPAPPKRKKQGAVKERSVSFKYGVVIDGAQIVVCKPAFCELFKVGRKKIALLQEQIKRGQSAPKPDMQGRHKNRPHKIKDEVHNFIREHIKSFPSEASHYSRHVNPNRRYLSPLLTVKKMYSLYIEKCAGKPADFFIKEATFRHIFCTEFNLGIGEPRSDTCSRCDSGENNENHIAFYKAAFQAQKNDKDSATNNEKVCFMTMDMQQTMPLPKLSTSKAFYLRQIWFYNFGVHTITKTAGDMPFMFTWTEDIASRGSNEIASCLYYFTQVASGMLKNVDHLKIWSDSCSGQNKNFNIIALYQYLIFNKIFKVIDHKFPEVGHSYLDSDRDFGRIEKKIRKHEKIYTPEQYRNIIRDASRKNAVICDMEHHFLNMEELPNFLHLINRKKNTENEKVNFRDDIKWIRVQEFGCYLYKTCYDEEVPFKKVNILKRQGYVPENSEIAIIREKTGKLSQEKLENIKTQLPFIDREHRWFYDQFFDVRGEKIYSEQKQRKGTK